MQEFLHFFLDLFLWHLPFCTFLVQTLDDFLSEHGITPGGVRGAAGGGGENLPGAITPANIFAPAWKQYFVVGVLHSPFQSRGVHTLSPTSVLTQSSG